MAIVQIIVGDGTIKTYSDAGYYIRGGSPAGMYETAVDPADAQRTYTETDVKIPPKHKHISATE